MATEILILNGTTNEGWPTEVPNGATHHTCIDEYPTPDTGDYIQAEDDYMDDSSYYDVFTIPDCSDLQAEDTVVSLEVYAHVLGIGTSTKELDILVTNSDGTVSDSLSVPTKGATTRNVTFTVDSLAAAWTLAKINDISAIEIRPSISGKDQDDDTWAVYQLYVQVNYTLANANLDQEGFRICTSPGNNSDPDDTTDHVWANENIDVTGIAKESPIFMRFSIAEGNVDNSGAEAYSFYYNTTDDPDTATQITTTSNVVRIVNDPYNVIANEASCNTELISSAKTFEAAGHYIDSANETSGIGFTQNYHMEIQACIQFQSDAGDGTDYYFYARRLGRELGSHTEVPKVTTAEAAGNPWNYYAQQSV